MNAGCVKRRENDAAREVSAGTGLAQLTAGAMPRFEQQHYRREDRERLREVPLRPVEARGHAARLEALVARADGVGVSYLRLERKRGGGGRTRIGTALRGRVAI